MPTRVTPYLGGTGQDNRAKINVHPTFNRVSIGADSLAQANLHVFGNAYIMALEAPSSKVANGFFTSNVFISSLTNQVYPNGNFQIRETGVVSANISSVTDNAQIILASNANVAFLGITSVSPPAIFLKVPDARTPNFFIDVDNVWFRDRGGNPKALFTNGAFGFGTTSVLSGNTLQVQGNVFIDGNVVISGNTTVTNITQSNEVANTQTANAYILTKFASDISVSNGWTFSTSNVAHFAFGNRMVDFSADGSTRIMGNATIGTAFRVNSNGQTTFGWYGPATAFLDARFSAPIVSTVLLNSNTNPNAYLSESKYANGVSNYVTKNYTSTYYQELGGGVIITKYADFNSHLFRNNAGTYLALLTASGLKVGLNDTANAVANLQVTGNAHVSASISSGNNLVSSNAVITSNVYGFNTVASNAVITANVYSPNLTASNAFIGGKSFTTDDVSSNAVITVRGYATNFVTSNAIISNNTYSGNAISTFSNTTGGIAYVNTILIQDDTVNGYIRPRRAGSNLFLGSADSNWMTIGPTGKVILGSTGIPDPTIDFDIYRSSNTQAYTHSRIYATNNSPSAYTIKQVYANATSGATEYTFSTYRQEVGFANVLTRYFDYDTFYVRTNAGTTTRLLINSAGLSHLGNTFIDSASNIPVGRLNGGTGANASTFWAGDGTWKVPSGSGGTSVTILNNTSHAASYFPLFANTTSGTASTIFTSNNRLLYTPSTGELAANVLTATSGFHINSLTISANYTISSGNSAMSTGPITVANGVSVTISSGSRWVIL